MYADQMSNAMRQAIDETNRRREKQVAYNKEHGIEPATIEKAVRDTIRARQETEERARTKIEPQVARKMEVTDLRTIIAALETEMREAAQNLEFERAAALRDEIAELSKILPR